MELIKPGTRIDFVGRRRLFVTLSVAVIALCLIGILFAPGPNWGIDFKGGAEMDVEFKAPIRIEELRDAVEALNLGDVKVQSLTEDGVESQTKFLIQVEQIESVEDPPAAPEADDDVLSDAPRSEREEPVDTMGLVESKLNEVFGAVGFEIIKTDFVGRRVSEELLESGVKAIIYSIALLLIYITLRFEFKYAIGAVLALLHDVTITTGAFVFSQKALNLPIVAALLTIVGYSLNDTIVVFDRVRENMRRMRRLEFNDMVNASVNEVLPRTLITSGTTLITVSFLWWLGGGVIQDFAFALIVGVLVGTYSSVFIASAFVVEWETWKAKRRSPAAGEKVSAKTKDNGVKL